MTSVLSRNDERKVDVSDFERFDLTGRAASPPVVAQRWRDFHREVRRLSSGRIARVIGPWLGEDTFRRRLIERLRPAPRESTPGAPTAVSTFPTNYVSTPVFHGEASETIDEMIAFVMVDPNDPAALVREFNQALASSQPWLLITDQHEGTRRETSARLLLAYGEGADVVFADEVGDVETIPLLKPRRVGPHTLLSYNVVGRPALLRRESALRHGGLRVETGRAAEHDLYLRLLESGAIFRHAPFVLPGRTSLERRHHELAHDTARVVGEALRRRGLTGEATAQGQPPVITWSPTPDEWPSIDIIIPTRDRVDLLRQCIDSVEGSSYPRFAITILDNGSQEPATLEYLAATSHRVIDCPGPFNYAAIINRGVASCRADYLVTLNNDTVVRTKDWLEQMVGAASLDDVSIVGATLLDHHDAHEHDGIVIAPYPQHLRRGINYLVDDEFVRARRDVAAVTGAVQMISRELYLELGGMDEELAVVMNDVDLCLRSQNRGRHVVMLPDVVLSHFAGSTRGRLDPLADRNRFVRRWDVFGELVDPFFPETMRLYGTTIEYNPTVSD